MHSSLRSVPQLRVRGNSPESNPILPRSTMSCDMNGPHAGRVVLITGAGGGVGRGYALL